jgi:hypothetical protein
MRIEAYDAISDYIETYEIAHVGEPRRPSQTKHLSGISGKLEPFGADGVMTNGSAHALSAELSGG